MNNGAIVIGVGSIGQAIARRADAGALALLTDLPTAPFITVSDLPIDGGVTAPYRYGDLAA